MSSAAARRHYSQDGLGVVSNERLLVMLFERLDRDLAEAASRCALSDRSATHVAIMHAQDIIYELLGALDTEVWAGASDLQAVYVFCLSELIEANMAQDAQRIENCRNLLAPIGDTWREAATKRTASGTPTAS